MDLGIFDHLDRREVPLDELMFGNMSEAEATASIDLFAAAVVPHLAALSPPGA